MVRPAGKAFPAAPVRIAATLLSIVLIVGILYAAKVVLIPLALAVLLTFVLSPIVGRLGHYRVPRVPAVLVVVGFVGLLLAALGWVVVSQVGSLAADLPNYRDNMRQKVIAFREGTKGGVIEKVKDSIEEASETAEEKENSEEEGGLLTLGLSKPIQVKVVEDNDGQKVFGSISAGIATISPALGTLATGGFVLVLVIFMLIHREDLRNRLLSFAENGSLARTTTALDDAAQRISRYLLMQLIINGSFGAAIGLGLLLLGIPYALLWGLCAMVFRYIPYIGPWVAATLPIATSLVTSPGWTQVFLVIGLFLVLELLSNNVMEPWLYGQGVGISVVALLVSAAFWTWIWGPIGLVLATPLTVCLAVMGKYVRPLSFLDRLLADRPPLKPHVAFLQRMLAHDATEASEILCGYREKCAAETMYDEVLIPALAMVRLDRTRGNLEAAQEKEILESSWRILDALPPVSPDPPEDAAVGRSGRGDAEDAETTEPVANHLRLQVLGCPAHGDADELSLHMLDHALQATELRVNVLSTKTLPSDVLQIVQREKPIAVLIAAVPPGGLIQARYLCKSLRKRFPELVIIIGCWRYQGNLDRVIRRFRSAGARHVTTTLIGAKTYLRSLVPKEEAAQATREESALQVQ
jgi:predicted PurR-regulated permease PerM